MGAGPARSGIRKTDEILLRSLVGATTLARGRDYALHGMVTDVEWDPSGLKVTGRVRGRAAEPYEVSVILTRRPGGQLRSMAGNCTCPVQFRCKHAVALLLSSLPGTGPNRKTATLPAPTAPATPTAPTTPAGRAVRAGSTHLSLVPAPPSHQPGPAPRPAGPTVAPPRPAPARAGYPDATGTSGGADGWAKALTDLVASVRPSAPNPGVGTGVVLGLQFEALATRPQAGRSRDQRPPGPGIRMRPVTLSDRGNWVRSGVSWTSLDYFQGWRAPVNAAPVLLLRELRALARLGDSRRWMSSGEESMWLESVNSRRLWDLLAEAETAGLALVGSGRGSPPVILERDPAAAVIEVGRDPDGGLAVRAGIVAGGADGPVPAAALLLGRPAHGVAWWDGTAAAGVGDLHLARLDSPVPEAVAALVTSASALRVPERGVARFEAEVFPALRRHLRVTARDGTYLLPAVADDRVVCRLTHGPGPTLDVDWALVAGSAAPRPVSDPTDAAAEKTVASVVDVLGWGDHLVVAVEGRLVPAAGRLRGLPAARFMTDTVPSLAAIEGLDFEQVGAAPDYRELTDAPTVRLAAAPGASGGTDWLDLAVEVTVGGEAVPFEELFVALAEGESHLLLPSGGYFSLERAELRQLADLIVEARALKDSPPATVRLSRFSASLYEDLAAIADTDTAGWVDTFLSLAGPPARRPLPEGLAADLRPYQQDGFEWLVDRYERGIGAVLADDMGLGKTVQALAVVCHARQADPAAPPFLVVAPASVTAGWASEAARFAPGLRVVTAVETARRRGSPVAELAAGADLVITSYTIFRLDHEDFAAARWSGLLLDEAQFVKNPASHAAQAARRLPCGWKLAMTGTPLENSLAELWSLLAVTCPGLLGPADRFDTTYRQPIERRADGACLERLRRRIRPVMLRRTKAEVLSDLPDKLEAVVELDLDPRHHKRYQTHLQRERQKLLGLLGDMKANRVAILSSLTTLRQAALDVSLIDPDAKKVPSTKLDHLDELLAEAVSEGHRVLVFSQFTRFLSEARRRAEAAGIACCYLDGRTRKRAEVIERFRQDAVPVFFISLKAGGFGLNLTEADHAVLLDPWWNPATENQAVDRIHRIGQTRKVMVHRLVARDTIEEKVMALKARKAQLFDSVMGGDGFSSASLTADDVRALLD